MKVRSIDRLIAFLDASPAQSLAAEPVDGPKLAAKLSLAKRHDHRVHALMVALVSRDTSFSVYDWHMFPECLTREPWDAEAVDRHDVCLAKNGGGDLHLWNAVRGDVRLLVHDEAWRCSRHYRDVDDFIENELALIVEMADEEQIEEADDAYLARFRFAIQVAGSEGASAAVRAKLAERVAPSDAASEEGLTSA